MPHLSLTKRTFFILGCLCIFSPVSMALAKQSVIYGVVPASNIYEPNVKQATAGFTDSKLVLAVEAVSASTEELSVKSIAGPSITKSGETSSYDVNGLRGNEIVEDHPGEGEEGGTIIGNWD